MCSSDLMETVSFVFQDTFLFFDTIYQNIAVGKPEAAREEVMAAARAAQCHEFIDRLEQGYETVSRGRRGPCFPAAKPSGSALPGRS